MTQAGMWGPWASHHHAIPQFMGRTNSWHTIFPSTKSAKHKINKLSSGIFYQTSQRLMDKIFIYSPIIKHGNGTSPIDR
jgi:hypothetical protein